MTRSGTSIWIRGRKMGKGSLEIKILLRQLAEQNFIKKLLLYSAVAEYNNN